MTLKRTVVAVYENTENGSIFLKNTVDAVLYI